MKRRIQVVNGVVRPDKSVNRVQLIRSAYTGMSDKEQAQLDDFFNHILYELSMARMEHDEGEFSSTYETINKLEEFISSHFEE